jgi:hypothetical protein
VTAVLDAPRVVVYGEYPPFTTPVAAATLATVRHLLADGREIDVVSPRPSAAHHYADIGSPSGAARLARLVGGGAELIARFDPGILGASGGKRPAAARTAAGLAVRRARRATILLSPLTAPPATKWVRAILGSAEQVVVASQEDADRLRAAGLDGQRLSVSEEAWWSAPAGNSAGRSGEEAEAAPRRETPDVPPGASRDELEALVRRRAATDREGESANPVASSWPLHMLTPLTPAPTEASKPLFRLVKRFVHRLVAWEVVPIVEQVNHLQRATIESIDRQSETVLQAQMAEGEPPPAVSS